MKNDAHTHQIDDQATVYDGARSYPRIHIDFNFYFWRLVIFSKIFKFLEKYDWRVIHKNQQYFRHDAKLWLGTYCTYCPKRR